MIIGILIGLIVLVLLVTVHELGHAIVARRNGVTVEEFGIGFPPRAWGKKLKNGILFTLNWLPLGGFVRLKGEYDAAKGKGAYGSATFWQKTKILLAGVVMNWVVAAVLLTILAWVGLPKILPNQFVVPGDSHIESSQITLTRVVSGSAADKAGFKQGDVITAIDAQPVTSATQFAATTKAKAGKPVVIVYKRDGGSHERQLTLGSSTAKGAFGASLGQRETIHATWSAPIVGIATTGQLTWETLSGLGGMLGKLASGIVHQFSPNAGERQQAQRDIGDVSNSVAGPVGILGIIFPSAWEQGIWQVVFLAAIISLTLAVMNILPIPALDGGRWWTMALFRLFRKDLTKEREETVQGIGFLILMVLILAITASDILKLW